MSRPMFMSFLRRVESCFRDECVDLGRLAEERWPETNAGVLEIGSGAAAVYMGPGMYVNRAVGLGLEGPVSLRDLEEIEEFYTVRNHPTEIQLRLQGDPSVDAVLADRGYRPGTILSLYVLPLEETGETPQSSLTVPFADGHLRLEPVDDALFPTWRDVHGDGFLSDSTRRSVNDAFCEIAMQLPGGFDYVAFLGDEPVAVCSLIVRRKTATLGGMATLPRYRGRGIQDALLRARIDLARAFGCDLAITSCESGSGSGRNITRAGFRHLTNHGFFQRPSEPAS